MRAPAAQLYRVIFLLILRLPLHERKEKKKETNERKIHSCDDDDKQEVKTCRKIIKHSLLFSKMSTTKSYLLQTKEKFIHVMTTTNRK